MFILKINIKKKMQELMAKIVSQVSRVFPALRDGGTTFLIPPHGKLPPVDSPH